MKKKWTILVGFIFLFSCQEHQKIENNIQHSVQELKQDEFKEPLTTVALSESDYDFGTIVKGAQVEHIYQITNTGSQPLIISKVQPGCGCTIPEFTKEPILPGGKGKIKLKFNSSNFIGIQKKFAHVFANVKKSPIVLTFVADIN